MRRRIKLYINNLAVDMDEQSLILFTYTKENLDNPSLVRNSYSKQITLKGTARNNRVFEEMYRLDRTTGTGQLSVLERIPFSIIADGGVCLEKGYCKIDSIKRNGARCEYTITLYGQLGAFFYKLTTNDNGDALTLADLTYLDGTVDKNTHIATTAQGLNTLWGDLSAGTGTGKVVNFNPCYNGVPEEFDNEKAMVHAGDYANLPLNIGGYRPKDSTNNYIVDFGKPYDLQDTDDLRAYLMRPMLSVVETMKAVQAYALAQGMTFTIDNGIMTDSHIAKLWMTIANVPAEDREQGYSLLGTLLEGTPSPASFIIGLARLFGYSFITDTEGNVTMVSRGVFYNDATLIDITKRVNIAKNHTITPVFAAARWFDFALEGVGEYAKKHKEQIGREYGSQRVDTSYQFGEATTNIYNGLPFKICANLKESGIDTLRSVVMHTGTGARVTIYHLLPVYDSTGRNGYTPTAILYDTEGASHEVQLPLGAVVGSTTITGTFRTITEDAFWFLRNQMCDDDRKAIEGIGTLMLFDSFKTTVEKAYPAGGEEQTEPQRVLYLHSYDAARVELNGGTDCWDMTKVATTRTTIPFWNNEVGAVSILPTGIFEDFWENYIADRYDKDSRVWKCSVDVSGMQVGDALLRRFYYYGGAIWVLNKINNYSLTTYDAVECEFVKVKDITDYNDGQTL